MDKKYIYNAGPLFTEADQAQRLKEQSIFDTIDGIELFNPLTSPQNEGAISAEMIYNADNEAIQKANVFFFDLANNDPGTLVELGMVIEKLESGSALEVYPIISDFRVSNREEYKCEYSPVGYNSFVIGSLEKHKIKIYKSFQEAFQAFTANKISNLKDQ